MRALFPLVFCLAACVSELPRFRGGTPELRSANPAVPLTRELHVKLDRPGRIEVELSDSRGTRVIRFDDEVKDRDVPLVGVRPGDAVTVTVTAFDERGSTTADPLEYEVGALPARFPRVEVLAADPERFEPGLILLPVELVHPTDSVPYLLALDRGGNVVWVWDAPHEYGDLRMQDSGALLVLGSGNAWEISPMGAVQAQWGKDLEPPASASVFTDVDVNSGMNHEVFPLPDGDGFLTLTSRKVFVTSYPCSYDSPTLDCGPADLDDTQVIAFDRDGTVRSTWSLADRIDTFHIGFMALGTLGNGRKDWSHGNGVIPLPSGGVVASLRHQDALVALDEDGALKWILGDPAGWDESFAPYLLAPSDPDLTWPYHQHGPSFDADGVLWMFDNGNYGHTPYTPATGEPERSRVVGYRVDEAAMTVSQVAEFRETTTGELYSRALGNAEVMPTTGNVMGVYGMSTSQGDVSHESLGFGSRVVRLVEWAPDGTVVWDARLRSDRDDELNGWRSYRATRTASLYPAGAEVWLDGPDDVP